MITDFLSLDLMSLLGLNELPKERREALLDQMQQVLDARITTEILMHLSDEDKEKLDDMVSNDGDVANFLREKIPNLDILVAEIIAGFKKEIFDMNTAVEEARTN